MPKEEPRNPTEGFAWELDKRIKRDDPVSPEFMRLLHEGNHWSHIKDPLGFLRPIQCVSCYDALLAAIRYKTGV